MYVIKESGEREKLDLKKLRISILQAGASKSLAEKTIREVRSKVYPSITTREIYHLVMHLLREEKGVAQRYSLKMAIMVLGPTGFPFEKFVARLLQEYGYSTKTDVYVQGKCVVQEIDVLAEKDGKKYMVECKYHNAPGTRSDLRVVMYTYARFLDVQHQGFVQPWLVTNTKCSFEAEKYAKCVNMKVISWNYPGEESLERLLTQKNLYPITTLESLTMDIKQKLVNANIMLVRDLLKANMSFLRIKTMLPKRILINLKEEARHVLEVEA